MAKIFPPAAHKMNPNSSLTLHKMSDKLYRNTRRTRYVFGFACRLFSKLCEYGLSLLKYIITIMGTRIGRVCAIIMCCHLLNHIAMLLYMKYCYGDSGVIQLIMELIYGKNYYNPICKQLLFFVYLTNSKVFSYLTGTQLLEYWFSRI